jgi:hypothetical protein
VDAFSSTTTPVAVLGVTNPLTVTLEPNVGDAFDKFNVVVEGVVLAGAHFAIRFATLTEPNPVARS